MRSSSPSALARERERMTRYNEWKQYLLEVEVELEFETATEDLCFAISELWDSLEDLHPRRGWST